MSETAEIRPESICFLRCGGEVDAEAFDRALRLCERTGAELSVTTVISDPPEGLARLLASWGASPEAVSGEAEEAAEAQRLVEQARRRGVKASSEVLHGQRYLEAHRKVVRDKHDLLLKATQPVHIVERVLFGHTDRQLVRQCPCPVWIEKPAAGQTHNRILAAVDPAPFQDEIDHDPVREELNASILRHALLLAELEDAELHVVHAWEFVFEAALRSRAGLHDDAVESVGDALRQKHDKALTDLLRPYLRHIARIHLVKGAAGEEIVRLSAREQIDVIVMGTVCRSGLGGWLIGNTAETVLDHADCSLMALKPPGFVMPDDG